ncbi:Sir2 family NAD-dependent protein deacetylase [Pseudorhodoplanes sp.]|uniref:SIR2 family NAD-dependent protein deacylase n=1 Tax=Pseudorhodoplanes sp. TaxID=1934341 RepID=UPI002BAFCB1C|nr:Sir2 family NAD-dependent protein deacetylase [Pseudorhodoplanes sp.]HWV41065.1 Sir2 family NAD-dependent protein deacetylase [Pseudorhodoplanes sp.]
MIAPDLQTATAALRAMIENSERVVPFTGAGISTESGIPDFRSPGGLWTKTQPIPFDVFMASSEMRDEAWRRRFAMEDYFGKAKPTRGHLALASLYRAGKTPGVITQNIDNLHQAAGVPHEAVIELHGNTTFATCLECAKRYELPDIRDRFEASGHAPDCECGGYIKTATVSFGQAMPEEAMRRAQEWASDCDLFIAIGSSLVVWPAAGFPLQAKKSGAQLVIINREPTDFDSIADLVIRHDIGDALAPLIAH